MIWSVNQIELFAFFTDVRILTSTSNNLVFNKELLIVQCEVLNKISVKQEKVCSTRFPVMSLTKILETFIRSFPSSFNRKYVHTVACTVVVVGPAHFVCNAYAGRNATCPLSSCSNKTISTVACKGPLCVEVLSSSGRLFVEEGQFINSTSSLHLCRHFFNCWRRLALNPWNRESESSGSQPVYRKLFPRCPHSSKNNFFEIKISRPTSWESLSVLLWLLQRVNMHPSHANAVFIRSFSHMVGALGCSTCSTPIIFDICVFFSSLIGLKPSCDYHVVLLLSGSSV